MDVIIRKANENDYEKIYSVIETSFKNAEHTDHDEHNLVKRLRKSEGFIPELSIVAEYNREIIGHILFTKVKVNNDTLIALAPLAVIPSMQGKGIGGKLINEGHRIAREIGYSGSIVLGHDKYYPRFGYKKASIYSISAPFEVPDENFMAIEFSDNSLIGVRGTVEYAKEFFEV